MSARSLVLAGRTLIATLMPDTGVITRSGGPLVFDPATGDLTAAAGVVIYEGPCRLRTPTATDRLVIFGDTQVTAIRFAVTFPHDIPDVRIDDVVTITESDDPNIGLRSFRVVSVPSASYLIYRDIGVEVIE